MLFHAPEFIFLFLPITLAGYYFLGHFKETLAFVWLAVASLIFYGFWSTAYLPLILASIAVNYCFGVGIVWLTSNSYQRRARAVRNIAIGLNLATLGYFKYLIFGVAQVNWAFSTNIDVGTIILPIGISFYTFTQIAYLIDASQGKVKERSFISYLLFVTYFPHLIAGPILHHKEMMPQFADRQNLPLNLNNFAMGLTLFGLGLFKKVVMADGVATMVGPVFDGPSENVIPVDAWLASLAYTLQIYFDFSGYSDMAVGLSLMFNVRLPINFYSPYQSGSIIEFWRRWHMTLSRFLKEYVYIGLGGNRYGKSRRYMNLLATMLLGGIWHGANWTFVIWGALHGLFLCINHAWRAIVAKYIPGKLFPAYVSKPIGVFLTLLAVVVAWVFFRAPNVDVAMRLLSAMAKLPLQYQWGVIKPEIAIWVPILLAWVLLVPNTNQLMNYRFGSDLRIRKHRLISNWRPSTLWATILGSVFFTIAAVSLASHKPLEFLYFQF